MNEVIALLGAISWPIAFLIFGVVAAFGGLNKPLMAMSNAFGGIFKDLRAFKDEMVRVEKNLEEISNGFPSHIANIEKQVSDIELKIDRNMKDVFAKLQETMARVTAESLLNETDIDVENEVHDLLLNHLDAQKAIVEIAERWNIVKTKISEKYPDAKYFDKREYGQAIRALANGNSKLKPSIELAEISASLHSRFKGFTRRRSYAHEWLTSALLRDFRDDTAKVLKQIAEA